MMWGFAVCLRQNLCMWLNRRFVVLRDLLLESVPALCELRVEADCADCRLLSNCENCNAHTDASPGFPQPRESKLEKSFKFNFASLLVHAASDPASALVAETES